MIDIWFKELNNQSTWFLLKHYKGVYKTFGLINLDYIWLIRVLKTIFATLDKQCQGKEKTRAMLIPVLAVSILFGLLACFAQVFNRSDHICTICLV